MQITDPGNLPASWRPALSGAVKAAGMLALADYLAERKAGGARICPPEESYFRALELTPLNRVRAVILGQDPYHQFGRADGLCFSMQEAPAHSLKNILEELQRDVGNPVPNVGTLDNWAREGVLLLNTILTVEEGKPLGHKKKGWEQVTAAIIRAVAQKTTPVVFMLWGGGAKRAARLIREEDETARHCILETSHPSGQAAWRGFRGCGHFSKANEFLTANGQLAIDWTLPSI